jgi:hypothetical protein
VWEKQNQSIQENALFSMLNAMFLDLKGNHFHSKGAVIDVHDYIKKIIFPFSMFQVIIIINT